MLRIIQWATGNVGRQAVAAVSERVDVELVGALVYSDAKAGRDVGEVCGIAPIGVHATTDRDEIVTLEAGYAAEVPEVPLTRTGSGVLVMDARWLQSRPWTSG